MRIFLAVLVFTLISTGCVQVSDEQTSQVESNQASGEKHDTLSSKWLEYADPIAEANLAIAKHNYRLLALTGQTLTIPGVNAAQSKSLQARCGVQVLTQSNAHSSHHSMLVQYAEAYNKHILYACRKYSDQP